MSDSWARGFVATSTVLGEPPPMVPQEEEASLGALRSEEKVIRARAVAEIVATVLREVERTESSWRW